MTRPILDLGSWCILRCSSADTLRVAKSLGEAGLEVWTPVERDVERLKLDRSRVHKETALLPSYVFGRVEHVDEMLRLELHPGRDHPRFTVFRHHGSVPLIADNQLDALREIEGRKRRFYDRWLRSKEKPPEIPAGTTVRMNEGAYEGLVGIFEGKKGKKFMVTLPEFERTVEVASFLLVDSPAEQSEAA